MGGAILVIDDEPGIVEIAKIHLSAQGFQVTVASSGEMALRILKDTPIDLIICDFKMPKMDGHELLNKVRHELQNKTAFFIVTGYLSDKAELYDSGANGILGKPLSPDVLLEVAQFSRLPFEERFAQRPKEPAQAMQFAFGEAFDCNLFQFGTCGFFANKEQIKYFETFDRRDIVEFNFATPNLSCKFLKGVGLIQWIRYEDSDLLQAGMGIEIRYLEDESRKGFCDYLKQKNIIQAIPKGMKQRQ